MFLCLYLRIYEQGHEVVQAERYAAHVHVLHDVKELFSHFYLQTVAVASDDFLQGCRMCQLRIEPHTAFLSCRKLPLCQEEQEGGDFLFQLLQEIRVIVLQRIYLPYPVSCFPCVYDYRQVFVVGTQYELGEEGN